MFVISVHGRSGQGVETALTVLAKAVSCTGLNVQSIFFPSQERRGAHVWGLVKIDKGAISSKQIEQPDIALILNTNLDIKSITANVKEKGVVVFNSTEKIVLPVMKRNRLKFFSVDGTGIAMKTINKPIPNMALLGAAAKYYNKLTLKGIKSSMPDIDKENVIAIEEGFKMVK